MTSLIHRDVWIAVEDSAVALGPDAPPTEVDAAARRIADAHGMEAAVVVNLLNGQFALMDATDHDDDARQARLEYDIAVEQVDPDDDPVKRRQLDTSDLPRRKFR